MIHLKRTRTMLSSTNQLSRIILSKAKQCPPQRQLGSTALKGIINDQGCPIMLVGNQYLENPAFNGAMPKLDRLNYVDSDIKFLNYHSEGLAIAFSSHFDHCIRMNEVPDQKVLHIYFPNLITSADMNQSLVEENMDFFVNKYPLFPRVKSLYNKANVDFLLSCCRVVATMKYLSPEMRNAYQLVFSFLFLFDDVLEALNLIEDPTPFRAFRNNISRIIHNRENEVPRINLAAISSFPRDLLDLSKLHEDIYADILKRARKYGSENIAKFYARAWEYFMDGVVIETDLCRKASDGQLGMYTKEEMIGFRTHATGATLGNSLCNTDNCARFLQPEDALIAMCESAVCSEADGSTYFKEKKANDEEGRVVSINLMCWFKQAAGLSEHDALVACFNNRNKTLKAMVDTLPFIQPHHQLRYQRAMETVLIYNDYSLVGGINQQNNRYGWYPAFKAQQEK